MMVIFRIGFGSFCFRCISPQSRQLIPFFRDYQLNNLKDYIKC
jgi:hypothetical protein